MTEFDDAMAPRNRDENGSPTRATVALVDAKVDGLKDLVRAEFANIKEDVKALATVVGQVIRVEVQADDHERRLRHLESELESDRNYRRIHLPSLVIACVIGVGSIATTIITQLH